MKPFLVIIISPPGGGKGTQADLLAEKFGLFHLETSKIIEERFKKADPSDLIIAREKENWLGGKLVNQAIVAGWLLGEIEKKAQAGIGIVLSGSPRSLEEVEAEMPRIEELYGRDNIRVIEIKLSEDESVKRNSHRRICKANRHPIPNFPEYRNITACPQDGSEIITRALDEPEIIKERYRVYLKETAPVLEHLIQHGYQIISVNGEQPIEKVFEDILGNFND